MNAWKVPPVIPVAVAGGLMVSAGLSVIGLAGGTPRDTPLALTSETVGGLLLGIVLIAAGVEAIRRRHFWFAVLTPAFLALASAGYGIATGQAMVFATVLMYALVVVLVAASRPAFSPRGQAPT